MGPPHDKPIRPDKQTSVIPDIAHPRPFTENIVVLFTKANAISADRHPEFAGYILRCAQQPAPVLAILFPRLDLRHQKAQIAIEERLRHVSLKGVTQRATDRQVEREVRTRTTG